MLESRVFRYCVYGVSFIVISEVAYRSYVWIKYLTNKAVASKEICEVIWTNELTQSCVSKHRRFSSNPAATSSASNSPTMSELNRIVKLPSPMKKSQLECSNPFCAAYNVGRLLEFIDSAKHSMDLAMYTFTSYELAQAFNRALKRGVLIRIISDHEMAYSSGSQIIPLTKSGVPVRCNSNTMFMHHKFCIIDSPQRNDVIFKKQNKSTKKCYTRGLVLTGSLNWTMQGFGGNWENILISSNAEYVRSYSNEFERMWNVFSLDMKVPSSSSPK
ncbi:mitochondrial cardiolipin hydrolase [Stomoxys calcitrans]|uniref:Mitochondrial cardiolipin hydrolase n=1 Tax=Stomoxys calcitrans TaxID=35570 RepID=A0A1I8PG51_STOCA|nr:mitochondrial cardiolipin hydrolase [Stomoxys calcitrans]XP_059223599.1 mitochondrial cardiolipin hydrolase [Stomoxys calcitrans]